MKLLPLSMALTALHRFGPGDLNPNEQIIYRAHLHFVAFLISSKTWIVLIGVGIAILILAFLFHAQIGFFMDRTITIGVFLFVSLFLVYPGYRLAVRFVDWIYDEDIITNQRVIDYDQKFLFSKDMSTASMKSVEDIILHQAGFIRNFFNYGTLDVQTPASGSHSVPGQIGKYLVLYDVARPVQVQRLIDEIVYRVKRSITVDPEEVLISCGLKSGDLDQYFVVKKTGHWKDRVKKLLGWK